MKKHKTRYGGANRVPVTMSQQNLKPIRQRSYSKQRPVVANVHSTTLVTQGPRNMPALHGTSIQTKTLDSVNLVQNDNRKKSVSSEIPSQYVGTTDRVPSDEIYLMTREQMISTEMADQAAE